MGDALKRAMAWLSGRWPRQLAWLTASLPVSAEDADRLIVAMSADRSSEGLGHLARKLDHLVHAMRVSGRLAGLSRAQVDSIAHALRASGHDHVPQLELSTYSNDGLLTIHNADFLADPHFLAAYERGVVAAGKDYCWRWRVHVGLWAAAHGARLSGDFVECGVNRGFLSSAILRYLDWDRLDRRFFLLDTYQGLDEALLTDEERAFGRTGAFNDYTECFQAVQDNFAEFRNVIVVRGRVPDTLSAVDTDAICYLHLDMNCVRPEVAAAEYFWDRLVPGAVTLLDDYGHLGFEPQKRGMDEFARRRGVPVLSLPTGQGLILKPAPGR